MFIYRVALILLLFFASFGVVAQTNPNKERLNLGIIMGSVLDAIKADAVSLAKIVLFRFFVASLK